jgi:hypothetical protein
MLINRINKKKIKKNKKISCVGNRTRVAGTVVQQVIRYPNGTWSNSEEFG